VECEVRCDSRLRERLGTKGYNEAVRVLGGLIEHTADTAAITGA
jgi:hypothetical protein